MNRPMGITVLAVVALIWGLVKLLVGFGVLTASGLAAVFGGPVGMVAGAVGAIAGCFLIIGPILQILFGIGALSLRPWAWWMGIVGTGITVFGALLRIMGGAPAGSTLFSVAIPLLILIYLLRQPVRQVFGIGARVGHAV